MCLDKARKCLRIERIRLCFNIAFLNTSEHYETHICKHNETSGCWTCIIIGQQIPRIRHIIRSSLRQIITNIEDHFFRSAGHHIIAIAVSDTAMAYLENS